MMRSLFSGVSGMRNHQIQMDVIGNNIANVNTVGFKGSRVSFQELLNQTVRGGSAAQANRGGTNPMQIGLGARIGAIETLQTPGSIQSTGKSTDLAIQGDGYFVVSDGGRNLFTRSGAFTVDEEGWVTNGSNGYRVMGWNARDGVVNPTESPVPVQIPKGETMAPIATTTVEYTGNLDARTTGSLRFQPDPVTVASPTDPTDTAQLSFTLRPTGALNEWAWEITTSNGVLSGASGTLQLGNSGQVIAQSGGPATLTLSTGTVTIYPPSVTEAGGGVFSTDAAKTMSISSGSFAPPAPQPIAVDVFDSLGQTHSVTIAYTKVGDDQWSWQATDAGGASVGNGTLRFEPSGKLAEATGGPIQFTPPGASTVEITPDFTRVTQFAEPASQAVRQQNGYPSGTLNDFYVDNSGMLRGVFSNGLERLLGQISLANFSNPAGLMKAGDTLYAESSNSGSASIGGSGIGGRGNVTAGSLEMSNVDLSQEFTTMIVTQRGFQANSRVITTSDEMLQELVNLKR